MRPFTLAKQKERHNHLYYAEKQSSKARDFSTKIETSILMRYVYLLTIWNVVELVLHQRYFPYWTEGRAVA